MTEFEIARASFLEGLNFLDSKDYTNAEQKFRDALRILPQNKSVITNLSVTLFALKKFSEAQEFAEQALRLDEENIEACCVLANCLSGEKRFSEALPILEKI